MIQPRNVFFIIFAMLYFQRCGSLENEPDCGMQTAPLDFKSRIIGGISAQEGEWPWQAMVTYKTTVVCGAGLLRNNWVVTLAQCIKDSDPSPYVVVMGTNNLVDLSSNVQMRKVKDIFIYPSYIQGRYDYDIALLKTEPFTITNYVRTVCVPTADEEHHFTNGTMCTTAGFGATREDGGIQPVLNNVNVPIVDQEKCRDVYSIYPKYPVTDNMICLGKLDGGKGVCTGDGPSVLEIDNKWFMVGIPSWYVGCSIPGYPAVYTRMTSFEEWLTPIYEGKNPKRKDLVCGRQMEPTGPDLQIVGGRPSKMGEWPWQAAVYVKNVFKCGASLLTPEWIVTSSLCVPFLNDPSVYLIRMGVLELTKFSDNEQRRPVSAVYVHPNYTMPGYDLDIALLKLSSPFELTDYVSTICIPDSTMDEFYETGRNVTITGWGSTSEGGTTYPPLQHAEVPVYDQAKCRDIYLPDDVTDNMFCAGLPEGGRDSCEGDDGGPVVAKAGDQWFLTGIISWGFGCARAEYPGVNTKVAAFTEWIQPIYNGGEPETRPPECHYDEFLCRDGWCIDYTRKCNGQRNEGCQFSTDEEFCDEHVIFFDPFYSTQLDPNSIRESIPAANVDHCAQLCLNTTQYACMAFNFENINDTCHLAGHDYTVVPSTDEEILHFEMEKFPLPGTTITTEMSRLATPRWLPNMQQISNMDGLYVWILKPNTPLINTISIQFNRIIHGDPKRECKTPQTENFLVIRTGEEYDAPIVMQYCLHGLPETLDIHSSVVRLEFYSADAEQYGFIATYSAYWFCDQNLDTSPGIITSPHYPQNYQNNAKCNTLITAPEGHSIILDIIDFQLEHDDVNCTGDFDTLSIYNNNQEGLIGVYCSDMIPKQIRSEGRTFYLFFKSDSTVTSKGFHVSYYFESNSEDSTTKIGTSHTTSHKPSDSYTTIDPIRRDLQRAEQQAQSFMIATFVLIGLLVLILFLGFCFLCCCRRRPRDGKQDSTSGLYNHNNDNMNNGNAFNYATNATYTSEGVVVNIPINNIPINNIPINNNHSG